MRDSTQTASSFTPYLSIRSIVFYWVPVIAYLALIFYMSSLSRVDAVIPFSVSDKLLHLVEYGVLSWLLWRALDAASPFSRHAVIIAIIFAALYGISDEFHQSFVPGRSPDILDVAADCVGAVLAQAVIYLVQKIQRLRLAHK